MAKDKLTDYSATNASNTDVGGINIDEGMLPSSVNNSIRELMTHLKNFSDGTDAITGLTVDGNIKLDGNYPTGSSNVALGNAALDDGSLSGANNTAIGSNAMTANTSGAANTTVGSLSLDANTTGDNNSAFGVNALSTNTTADNNSAFGYQALYSNSTGADNTSVGVNSLFANTASNNTAVGKAALTANTSGENNVAVGKGALDAATTASRNSAVGLDALGAATTGDLNVAVGAYAGDAITTAQKNTAIGDSALSALTTSSLNTCVGHNAGNVVTGDRNTLIGTSAGEEITTGYRNTILGRYNGNQGGLDIRTANNFIVLSDGDGNPRQIINGSGDVFINTTSQLSDGKVSIAATLTSRTCATMKNTSTQGSGHTFIRFTNNTNAIAGSIQHTGTTTTSYGTSSDYRLKENVADMTDAIARVKQLAPKRFNFIADSDDTTVDGFLAHEAQAVVPEAVMGTHNEVDDDNNPIMQQIDHSKLVPVLTAALKEAITKIETLETKVAALEAE